MTFEERVVALTHLGLSNRQTRFLVTVALHGGFCLRRQFSAFAGVSYGKNVCDFLESLVERHLARRFSVRRDRGYVYHLHARPIYRAIAQAENRNRRSASSALIARKLMVLDYVLAHLDVDWIATEQDKVSLFAERFGVSVADLPQKFYVAEQPDVPVTVRYFIHKLPVAVVGDPPVVTFLFLALEPSARPFEQFLQDHGRLLTRLPAWTIVAVGQSESPALQTCERVFARFSPASAAGNDDAIAGDLLWYFERRVAVDADALASLSIADIDRFRVLRKRFQAPAFEARFRAWRGEQAEGADTLVGFADPSVAGRGRLVIHHLNFDYSQFGSLPGVA
jgi:hypothetical protein